MESRFIEEGLKVIVFSQMQFSVQPCKFFFSIIIAFLERKPVANTNSSYSSWFFVFIIMSN